MINFVRPRICWGYLNAFAVINGQVYAWGSNTDGQLGLGHYAQVNQPTKLSLPGIYIKKVVRVTRGTFALTDTGHVYGWKCIGLFNQGVPRKLQIDLIKNIKSYDFHYACVLVRSDKIFILDDSVTEYNLPPIIKISCGGSFIIALTNEKLYSMGLNTLGQLGLSNISNKRIRSFKEIPLGNIVTVKCGRDFSVAMDYGGKLYVWGDNGSNQLGLGDNELRSAPTELKLCSDLVPINISCGNHHTMVLLELNRIYVWGDNSKGQLGLGHRNKVSTPQKLDLHPNLKISRIFCFHYQTFVISANNNAYACGLNTSMRLGLSSQSKSDTLSLIDMSGVIGIDPYYSLVAYITNTGQIYVCGCHSEQSEPDLLVELDFYDM